MTSLAGVARRLGDGGIGPHLLLGRGEETTGGRDKDSILADAMEALIGAVHLGLGLDVAAAVVHRLFDPLLAESATRGAGLDWKTSLQELGAARGLGAPTYVVEDTGPDHAKSFTAAVLLSGTEYGRGGGRTKKAAEQEAAEAAWRALSAETPRPTTAGGLTPRARAARGRGGAARPGAVGRRPHRRRRRGRVTRGRCAATSRAPSTSSPR